MEKTCCMCKKSLSVEKFKSHKTRGLQSQCIECQKKYRREHYLKNKQKYVDKATTWRSDFKKWWKEFKKQYPCQECGENHPACIQFHHTDDNKENNVSYFAMLGSKDKLLKEIKKCVPLCGNCHSKKHWVD